MGEWNKLRRIWESFGGSSVPIVNPLESTITWRKSIYKSERGLQQDLKAVCEKASMAVENRYKLEQFVQHS